MTSIKKVSMAGAAIRVPGHVRRTARRTTRTGRVDGGSTPSAGHTGDLSGVIPIHADQNRGGWHNGLGKGVVRRSVPTRIDTEGDWVVSQGIDCNCACLHWKTGSNAALPDKAS